MRRIRLAAAALALVGAIAIPTTASAQSGDIDGDGNYVTTTIATKRSLDVSAFSPECIRDTPVISYTIVPVGFAPADNTADLVVRDNRGVVVESLTVNSLSGRIIYPGAAVDAQGNTTDWPGWAQADDGSWIPDPSDAHLREGLTIEVTVDFVSATATVSYPAADTPCANPPIADRCDPGDPACDPCVPGQNGDSNPADDCSPCVPGQNGDGNPADDCALPKTGQGVSTPLAIGAISLVAGLILLLTARRRRIDDEPTTVG